MSPLWMTRGDLKQTSEFTSFAGGVWGVESNVQKIRHLPSRRAATLMPTTSPSIATSSFSVSAPTSFSSWGTPRLAPSSPSTVCAFRSLGSPPRPGVGNNNGQNQNLYIPISTMQDNFAITGENLPADALTGIDYQPTSPETNETAKAEAHAIIAKRHGFDPNNPDAFSEWDTIKAERTVGVIFTAMDVFLGGVGVVTLALGAVGIINIMLVTVTERTKEIGLRKALGATNRSILFQFFLEGLALTGISGLIGILGAAVLMFALGQAMGNNDMGFDPPRLVPWSAAMALGTLTLCGVVAGIYPAAQGRPCCNPSKLSERSSPHGCDAHAPRHGRPGDGGHAP